MFFLLWKEVELPLQQLTIEVDGKKFFKINFPGQLIIIFLYVCLIGRLTILINQLDFQLLFIFHIKS